MKSLRATTWGLLTLPVILLWEVSGLDMALARLAGSSHGFAWRDEWWFTVVLHDGVRHVAWALVVLLCLMSVWPLGPFARLPFRRRLQMPAVALMSTALIAALKFGSATSCPWDLADFGGVAHQVWHWRGWAVADGGAGHCFPAGHAAAGFAWFGGWFAWRGVSRQTAARWCFAALSSGLVLGLVQQWRGAHFTSHTLWSGWICWMLASLTDNWFASAPQALPQGVEA